MTGDVPVLSVVVALISGRRADLDRCLTALENQRDSPSIEILVPFDRALKEISTLSETHPGARFLEVEGLDTEKARAGASREHHDTLRTIGLRAARGRVICLTEDHAIVSETWCGDMLRLLDEHQNVAAIGGAVECRSDRLLNWAVYYCDFGRYQNPLPIGPAAYVSDSNVAYRREALEAVSEAWAGDYHETVVHWALVEKGFELWLHPGSQVWQARSGLTLGKALRERYVWGRSFAGTRARTIGPARRIVYAILSCLLPFVLTLRVTRESVKRKRYLGRLFAALPLILILHGVWALGEGVGYLKGRP